MVAEQESRFEMPPMPKDLEQLWEEKERRLPKSVRKYIQRLKNEDRLVEAKLVRAKTLEAKGAKYGHPPVLNQTKARRALDRSIYELLTSEDPHAEAELEVKIVWLLEITGEINSEERISELSQAIDSKAPFVQEYLEHRAPQIRDEMAKLKP